jgi:ubiquinone/menaquinone biosynthesis methyltransferase
MDAREIFNGAFAFYYEKVINRISSPIKVNKWRSVLVSEVSALCPKAKFVMDCCSGAGNVGELYLKTNPEALLINCDISKPLLRLAKKRLASRASYVCADNRFFPVKDSSLDILFSSFCVRNSLAPLLTVKEAVRVLKPKGVWGILDFFRIDRSNIYTTANRFVFKSFMNVGKLLAPSHSGAIDYLFESIKRFYSVEEFLGILEDNGFNISVVKSFMGGIAHVVVAVKKG